MARGKRERQRQNRALSLLEESTATLARITSDLVDIDEAGLDAKGRISICIATPGWGTSGYYSADVLQEAATAGVFGAGVHMYWDHPTQTERHDRPERSLRDFAAVTETAGVWQDQGSKGPGVYALAKVFENYRPIVKELAPHIGVSMRSGAHVSVGEAEGRRGQIVDRIVESYSIDFVTKAGRGGAVTAVLEAAGLADVDEARNVGMWFESRIHSDFTTRADDMFGEGRLTREERIVLSNGIGAALDAFSKTVEELAPQLLTRDLWEPPAETPVTESRKDPDMTITAEERAALVAETTTSVVAALTEAGVITSPAANDEAPAELTEARTENARLSEALLVRDARDQVAGELAKVNGLPAPTLARLTEALTVPASIPTADGRLDTAKLTEAIAAAVTAEVRYLAEATGSPVTGVGDGTGGAPATTETLEAATTKATSAFQRLGLSEESAKLAVAGR